MHRSTTEVYGKMELDFKHRNCIKNGILGNSKRAAARHAMQSSKQPDVKLSRYSEYELTKCNRDVTC
jgi:hypothetical protein